MTKLQQEKLAITVFFISMMVAIIAVDIFAFQNSAVATISQVWLGINIHHWWATYLLVILAGIFVQHVSVSRNPGVTPDKPFWHQAILWGMFFVLGLLIGKTFFWQLPNID